MWEDVVNEENTTSPYSIVKQIREEKFYEAVSNALMKECKHSAPGARLSARLRNTLERMRPEERRAVASRTADGCAPLFVAARRGSAEVAEYLVHVCAAELEQRGVFEVAHDRSAHAVTPLWAAAVAGRLPVLRLLADAGARLDAPSDSGSTPVRSACFMTHLDVVRFLVERGADIRRPNYNGGTCLINSVQSVPLCAFLLQHGAEPDARDMQLKTALHYAIQEHRHETALLLLERGASPHLFSRAGDDALRTACLKGSTQIVRLLLSRAQYPPERVADAYELLGATQLDEFNDVAGALDSWRRATALRHAQPRYLEKRGAETHEAFEALRRDTLGGAREWRGLAELEALAGDVDLLRAQALLVAARVLGAAHRDTVFRLMYRGASYGDSFWYQRCIDLWMCALQIRLGKDSLLYSDTCHTVSALTRLMLDVAGGRAERAGGLPRHADALRLFDVLLEHLPPSRRALDVRPVYKRQADAFDRALRCVPPLLFLLLRTARGAGEHERVAERVRRLVRADVRSAAAGDTLLHACVTRLAAARSPLFAEPLAVPQCGAAVPASAAVAALLLRCGADACVRNTLRCTALHVAAVPANWSAELVEALLAGGAHLDQPNGFGDSALGLVALNRGSRVRPLRHVSLACLAARALLATLPAAPPPAALPRTLLAFLDLHRP